MPVFRKTAVVQLELPSGAMETSLPLACEREYGVLLAIDGKTYPAQAFHPPINDEQWREFIRQLRDCNVNRDVKTGYRGATAIRALGRQLYQSLAQLSPALRTFLDEAGTARRLVMQTTRPELHLLPWAGMYDESGHMLAAGDLSVVHAWDDFNALPSSTKGQLQLVKVLGEDTNQRTAAALQGLQRTPEIVQQDATEAFEAGKPVEGVDVLHLEKHGDAVLGETGQVAAATFGSTFAQAKIALLWSCYSGAANSWGESPALALHRNGAGLVLSFLAELHNEDAGSIAEAFYADVFGPSASRDPESALMRIRCAKATTEFAFANWASMTVYLRSPLDLSALPLNGPRVPASGWLSEAGPPAASGAVGAAGTNAATADPFWQTVAAQVRDLQPGSITGMDAAAVAFTQLPEAAFHAWRGNVIRLDETAGALPEDATLRELGLAPENAPSTDAADRLMWFFEQIERFGSPLMSLDACSRAAFGVSANSATQPGAQLAAVWTEAGAAIFDGAAQREPAGGRADCLQSAAARLRRRAGVCRVFHLHPQRASRASAPLYWPRAKSAGAAAADGQLSQPESRYRFRGESSVVGLGVRSGRSAAKSRGFLLAGDACA